MSEERSWGEDTVLLGQRARHQSTEKSKPRRREPRLPVFGVRLALGGLAVAAVVLGVVALWSGSEPEGAQMKATPGVRPRQPESSLPHPHPTPKLQPRSQREGGSLAIGMSRRAPRGRAQESPEPVKVLGEEPETTPPESEPVSGPVEEPAPLEAAPSRAPTPPADEFGM